MKKDFNFIWTYYDDVIVEGGGDFRGHYAQDVETIRTTYRGAVRHFYRERARLQPDDARGISPDFYIKKIDRFFHGDFHYITRARGYTRPQHFYSLHSALREALKHNARAFMFFLRLSSKMRPRLREVLPAIKSAWSFYASERETIKIIFN